MAQLAVLAWVMLAARTTRALPAVWHHEQSLDGDGIMLLRWNESQPGDDVLVLEVAARTRGYVGLGLSPYTGTMAGADLVLAWVDDEGVPHARDYWADQNGSPTLDKAQDWTVIGAEENATHTVIRLVRRLHTHHVMDVQIQPGLTKIIFSWSGADPGRSRTPHYHGKEQRGVGQVCLLSASASAASAPSWLAWAQVAERVALLLILSVLNVP